jgi:hypothetical protein
MEWGGAVDRDSNIVSDNRGRVALRNLTDGL